MKGNCMAKKKLARPRPKTAKQTVKKRLTVGEKLAAKAGMEYITKLPAKIPTGKILVHNQVIPAHRIGTRGSRAWLASHDGRKYVLCDCNWAAELGAHYRVKRVKEA